MGSIIAIVPPALPGGDTASAARCENPGCAWGAEQTERWRARNPNTARFLDFLNWLAFFASLSPAGPVPARTFGNAFGAAGISRPFTPTTTSQVRALPAVEAVSTRALGEVNEAVNLLDEAAEHAGLTGEEVQPEVEAAQTEAEALAKDLQTLSDSTATQSVSDIADPVAEADLAAKIESAADHLLQEAIAISDASAEGPVPTYAEIGSFDGDATAMSAASRDTWNSNWRDEVMTEVKSDGGQLGKNNKAIKLLLGPTGKIGSVPGAESEYTRLVGEFSDSLASPTKPAADAMMKFDNLQKEFSAPNKQGMEMTYLPKGNLDNVREAIAAKRMFEAGIADFKPGEQVSGLTPDYMAVDRTFVGDAVRMSGQRTADAVKNGIKSKISEKVAVYARTGLPVRVVIDASDNPALVDSSLSDFQNVVTAGVQSVPAATLAKVKDVVVLGPGDMLVQTDPSGKILKSVQGVRVKRSIDQVNPVIPKAWLVDHHSGKCVGAGSAGALAAWTLQTCDPAAERQKITLTTTGQLQAFDGDAAMCAAPNGSGPGAAVWSRSCAPSSSQSGLTWTVDAAGHVTNTLTGLVLDVEGDGTADGTKLVAYTSWKSGRDSNQNFDFITRTADKPMPLVNPNTGKCLTAPDGNNVDVVMQNCDGSAGQNFSYNSANQRIEVNGTRCLGHRASTSRWGGSWWYPIVVRNCDPYGSDEKWGFNTDGTISTRSVIISKTGCLDISGDSDQDGAGLEWYDCHAGYHNQRFTQFSLASLVTAPRGDGTQSGAEGSAPPAPAPVQPQKPTTIGSFSSGFEPSDPSPTWLNAVDNEGGGRRNVLAYCCGAGGPEAGVRSDETSHNGTGALLYAGLDEGEGAHAYMKVYDLSSSPLAIGTTYVERKTLSYWIYPQSHDTAGMVADGSKNSACTAVDLLFTDGSTLRDSSSWDQRAHPIHPHKQCSALTLDTWNHVTVSLDARNAGKQISRILVGHEGLDQSSAGSGAYRGYIDDITIS
ncbi:RICIN domain-containing protein [Kitasatospora sp. NPDC088346]|uniref:RICIN domain-containing protein n=1 Tax=Kitasatospora sp. NPDC088346 TaxID=3364073 RepID=UPI0038213D4E